jgi:hypothetical protein
MIGGTMMTINELLVRSGKKLACLAIIEACFVGLTAHAGDLTTDNLTVMKKATFYSTIEATNFTAPTNGMALFFNFADNTGTTITNDLSGNGNTGTVWGATWTANGMTNGAYSFDGNNDYIDCGNNSTLQIATGTISAWIKTANCPGVCLIAAKQQAYGIFLNNNTVWLWDWGGSGAHDTGINVADNAWHYITVTFQSGVSGGTIIYIDGAPRLSLTMSVANQTYGLLIGGDGQGSQMFAGAIDEVRIYNRTLSADEVLGLYYYYGSSVSEVYFHSGVKHLAPLGDLGMGVYTNGP